MDIVKQIQQYIESQKQGDDANKRYDNLAVEFLSTLDYSNDAVKKSVYEAVEYILSVSVESNKPLPAVYAKAMHYMLVKMSLTELGLDKTDINYHDVWESSGAAYYNQQDLSLNFNNEAVCSYWDLLSINHMPESRLRYFIHEVFESQHEIQHASQFKEINQLARNPERLNSMNYTMQLQSFARTIAESPNVNTQISQESSPENKYYTTEKSLYHKNHDGFLYELDADVEGVVRLLDIMGNISPKLYNLATDKNETYLEQKSKKEKLIREYSTVTWDHSSNPNNGPVSAAHKTSLIIDSVWEKIPQSERDYWYQTYPALAITRTKEGKKKTLDTVEKERDEKVAEIRSTANGEDVKDKVRNILDIYTAAIEQDALLSFEKQVQHIARLSLKSPSFFINPDGSLRLNPEGPFFIKSISDIKEELAKSTEKAKQIAAYVEDFDSESIKEILDKYKREAMHPHIRAATDQDMMVFDSKKHSLYSIENSLYHNNEFVDGMNTINKEKSAKKEKEQQEIENATSILQKIFPDFKPTPEVYATDAAGVPVIKNNVEEKLQLLWSLDDYADLLSRNGGVIKEDDLAVVKSAISTIYSFNVTEDEKKKFVEMLKANPNFPRIMSSYEKNLLAVGQSTSNSNVAGINDPEDDLVM